MMLEVRDPADVRSAVAEVPAMSAADVAAAYTRARAGFGSWRHTNPLDRAAVMARCAALDYYASFARQPWGEILADARGGTQTTARCEPVGVDAPAAAGLLELLRSRAEACKARAEGATVLTGGGRPAAEALEYGCYVTPTIISVDTKHSPWREEVFGPVFTTDLRTGYEFIDRAEAGQVSVNLPTSGWDVHHPFGGFRDSGFPFKEQGSPGLRFYTRIKTAAVRFAW